ncbi:RluA family pseudouridine synthase [Ruminococcus sp.]|uniref:RluA family pseudouridine synthase n=1 Tax=Ruminococcus sp. TaxID=41978 RepID=UPI0025D14F84|nr:RluA family pseudouridine synthase [Ruminococcus sp.]
MILTITTAENGRSLEDILRGRGFSKRLITKLKRTDNGMTRSGKLIRTIDIVTAGEKIEIREADGKALEPNCDLHADILYEDGECVVFSKPPFMPCHPSIKHQGDTLGNLFAGLYPDLTFRPVNRLDRNTSGCVLVAKSQRSAFALQQSFEKTYLGITKLLPLSGGRICVPIAREQESIIKRCVRSDGQYSATNFLVKLNTSDYSLIEFYLETGRTHQIRVHMAHIGYPLVGDDLYGSDCTAIKRQALHCGEVKFVSPESGTLINVKAPLPQDMAELLR